MVTIKSQREIELMREAGKILAKVHEELGRIVKPGISTKEIDRICEEMIRSHGCIPSFLNYEGYPLPCAFPSMMRWFTEFPANTVISMRAT